MSKASDDLIGERNRQIILKGFDEAHDDSHGDGSIAMAAACYAADEPIFVKRANQRSIGFLDPWPWTIWNRGEEIPNCSEWAKQGKDRRRQLVIAGALILAEIERLDRAAESKEVTP